MHNYITKRNLYLLVLLISFAAMSGSLYYSEIVGLTPCLLCWYQRILMYPIVFLSLVAVVRKSNELPYFALPLSILGAVIAAYHYALQKLGDKIVIATPCSLNGPSCTGIYVEYFGFITIPFMSLIAFIAISITLWVAMKNER